MWCRVLLLVTALSCTFLREITADADDLLCVLVLSGIQKDDLDVNLLKKLQRHNVNVDDLNNRDIMESCVKQSNSDHSDTNETAPTTETMATDNDPTESITSANFDIYDLNLNLDKEKVYPNKLHSENIETKQPNSNLINLWLAYKRHRGKKGNNFTKNLRQTSQFYISKEKETEVVPKATDLKLFRNTITNPSLSPVTTTESVKPKPLDIVSQQIMKFLINRHKNQDITSGDILLGDKTKASNTRRAEPNNIEQALVAEILNENVTTSTLNKSEENINKDTRINSKSENIIRLWITLNTTNDKPGDVQKSNKKIENDIGTTLFPAIQDKYSTNSQPLALDFMNKILRYFVTQQVTSTERTISTPDTVSIIPEIRKFFYFNDMMRDQTFETEESTTNTNNNTNKLHNHKEFMSLSIDKLANILDQTYYTSENPNLSVDHLMTEVNNKKLNRYTNMNDVKSSTSNIKQIISKEASNRAPENTNKDISKMLQEIKELLENKSSHTIYPNNINTAHKISDIDVSLNTNVFNSSINGLSTLQMPLHNSRIDQTTPGLPTYTRDIKDGSYKEELEHIFDMFETYLATKPSEPTLSELVTESTEIDTIAQKVKEYLERNKSFRKTLIGRDRNFNRKQRVSTKIYSNNNDHVTRRTNYMDAVIKQGQLINMSDSLELIRKPTTLNPNSQQLTNKDLTKDLSTQTIKPDSRPLLKEDIIKEITEKVKASVLKDIEKHIPIKIKTTTNGITIKRTRSTTIAAVTTKHKIIKTTTRIPSIKKENDRINEIEKPKSDYTDKDQNKTATNDIAEFFDLFQQFKSMRFSITTPKVLMHAADLSKVSANEYHGPMNAVFPSLLPIHENNNSQMLGSPIYVNPYHNFQINKPIIQQTKITNEIREIEYGVNLPTVKHQASIIQTDAFQVPILAIPVSHSISPINQNIILTTENPIVEYKKIYEHNLHTKKPRPFNNIAARRHRIHGTDSERLYNRDFARSFDTGHAISDTEIDRHSDTHMPRYYSDVGREYRRRHKYEYIPHSAHFRRDHRPIPEPHHITEPIRHSTRGRESTLVHHDFYKEYSNNPLPKDDVWDLIVPSQEHKHERFHEKLERPDVWPRETKVRQNLSPNEERKVNVASRQQVSLKDFKEKKKLYDDEHFLNFIQRQQKVNDMLERILKAQKSSKVHSVETSDTITT